MSESSSITRVAAEGFDTSHFVEEVPTELVCSICVGVFRDPRDTPCGCTFCYACIEAWLRKSSTCPTDRGRLTLANLKPTHRLITSMINRLKMRCPYHENGCEVLCTVDTVDAHAANCHHQVSHKKPNKKNKRCIPQASSLEGGGRPPQQHQQQQQQQEQQQQEQQQQQPLSPFSSLPAFGRWSSTSAAPFVPVAPTWAFPSTTTTAPPPPPPQQQPQPPSTQPHAAEPARSTTQPSDPSGAVWTTAWQPPMPPFFANVPRTSFPGPAHFRPPASVAHNPPFTFGSRSPTPLAATPLAANVPTATTAQPSMSVTPATGGGGGGGGMQRPMSAPQRRVPHALGRRGGVGLAAHRVTTNNSNTTSSQQAATPSLVGMQAHVSTSSSNNNSTAAFSFGPSIPAPGLQPPYVFSTSAPWARSSATQGASLNTTGGGSGSASSPWVPQQAAARPSSAPSFSFGPAPHDVTLNPWGQSVTGSSTTGGRQTSPTFVFGSAASVLGNVR